MKVQVLSSALIYHSFLYYRRGTYMRSIVCLEKILIIMALGCCALFAQAPATNYTFYFLPPSDDKWIAGNSYLYNGDVGAVENMQIEATRCGWFKKEFTAASDIPEKALIYLGALGRDKLDAKGIGADPNDLTWISLRANFGNSNKLYLIGDGLKFSTSDPGDQDEDKQNRCSYIMAAFIYDTDSTVNPSFSGNYHQPVQDGLRRGIVKVDLDTLRVVGNDTLGRDRKPIFARTTVPYANWVDKESFDAAFTPYGLYNGKVSNVPRCYDMSFGRASNGTWEFDSDKMLTPTGNNLVGGFYPDLLDSEGDADYTVCPTCRKEYTANCFNPTTPANVNRIPSLTYKGKTYTGMDAFDRANDRLPEGWNNDPNNRLNNGSNLYSPYAEYNVYDCGIPDGQPRPGANGAKKATANLSFCFESHGVFVYENGQEFFFRGDDDIWVFINNKLVIDLGGIHNPAPAFVDLDTLNLIEGETYPIDVFFCERMGTQSNVRVSTNMYITQKSEFHPEPPNKIENWMCATVSSGTGGSDCATKISSSGGSSRQIDLCGPPLIAGGYKVEFYMVNRTDTLFLSEAPAGKKRSEKCNNKGNSNIFDCYVKDLNDKESGIKIDSAKYSCGGRNQCKGNSSALNKVDIPAGDWTVYARLLDDRGQVGKIAEIDRLKSVTKARLVWGNLNTENNANPKVLKDVYGAITKKEQSIINGKSTPIYIAGGDWKDTVHTSFIYETDPEYLASVSYTIPPITGLKITTDSLGENNVAGVRRNLPPGGIDTLWVRGDDYYMGIKEFEINLDGISNSAETPSLKLTIYQPTLRFVDSTYAKTINPTKPNAYNGFLWWTMPDTSAPFVGRPLPVYVVAWDTVQNTICSHCTFLLSETSNTNNPDIGEGIVYSDAVKIVNGKQIIYIRGKDVVKGTDFATWRISGPSKGITYAEWTGLQFRDAPIPMPLESYVYDRNGDGIGDSLVVKFSKSFIENGAVVDSLLPVLLEVTWEAGNPVAFHNPNPLYKPSDLKNPDFVKNIYMKQFFTENLAYWNKYLQPDGITMIIADSATAFSKDVLTFGHNSGKGNILSYTPYYDQSLCSMEKGCQPSDLKFASYDASVFDRIPPIVTRAVYRMDARTCGGSKTEYCTDGLEVSLSEPVFADPDASDNLIKNPFSYCFEYSQNSKCKGTSEIQTNNMKWNSIGLNGYLPWAWEVPKRDEDNSYSARYKPSQRNSPPKYYEGASGGDNGADLVYRAYEGTRTPRATDWVKIRPPKLETPLVLGYEGADVLRDAAGNSANPREIGVLITGGNRYEKEQNKIASVDINDTIPLGGIFLPGGKKPVWITEIGRDYADRNLFRDTSITEFLPIPKGYPIDSVKKNYPGSVGTIINHGNIHDWVKDALLSDDCKDDNNKNGKNICTVIDRYGRPIPLNMNDSSYAEAVTLRASVFYHTNLGDYTAHKNPVEGKCTDPIFRGDPIKRPQYGNNCLGNEYNFYLAWDLKSNKGRYVGTGAYVAITKSYLQLDYILNGEPKSVKLDPDEFVEMFGARRIK